MNYRAILRLLGLLILGFSISFIPSLFIAIARNEPQDHVLAFALPFLGCFFFGSLLYFSFRRIHSDDFMHREGFASVTFGWILLALISSLPYWLGSVLPHWADAIFEGTSGITTTGSTVISHPERLAPSFLIWRAMTQWIGGMGILVLATSVLPWLGVGGLQILLGESGNSNEVLPSRLEDSIKQLWKLYFSLTLILCTLYWVAGMNLLEATAHAFSTLSTGGFSTRQGSIGAFQNPALEWISIVFMLVGSLNFVLHAKAFTGRPLLYFKNFESKVFLSLIVFATLLSTFLNRGILPDLSENFRNAAFQIVSIASSTGYSTYDYQLWYPGAQMILMTLMVIGGCSGSTAGGLKVMRVILIIKYAFHQLFMHIHPKAMHAVKLGHSTVSREVMSSVLGLTIMFSVSYLTASIILADLGMDFLSASSAVLSALVNVGPGFGSVGPHADYSQIPHSAKLALSFCMIIGRLEILTVMVLFLPSFWKR